MPSYGIPLLNAKKQPYEHISANTIACNAGTNHWRYAVLLLFGIEKTEYGRKINQATVAFKSKKLDSIGLFLFWISMQSYFPMGDFLKPFLIFIYFLNTVQLHLHIQKKLWV